MWSPCYVSSTRTRRRVDDDQERDAEEDHDAGRGAATEPLLVDHCLPGVDGERDGIERGALHDEDDVEDAERVERAEDQRDQQRRLQQRQRDLPELLPLAGAVDGRRLVDVAGDDLQPGQQEQAP